MQDGSAQQALMDIYTLNRGRPEGPERPVNMHDPAAIDWASLAQTYSLTPEEVEQLRVAPVEGPSLQERIQALRPNIDLGPVQLGTSGRKVTATIPF